MKSLKFQILLLIGPEKILCKGHENKTIIMSISCEQENLLQFRLTIILILVRYKICFFRSCRTLYFFIRPRFTAPIKETIIYWSESKLLTGNVTFLILNIFLNLNPMARRLATVDTTKETSIRQIFLQHCVQEILNFLPF